MALLPLPDVDEAGCGEVEVLGKELQQLHTSSQPQGSVGTAAGWGVGGGGEKGEGQGRGQTGSESPMHAARAVVAAGVSGWAGSKSMGRCGDGGELTPPLLANERAQRQLCTHTWLSPPSLPSSALGVGREKKALGWNQGYG